MSDDQAELLAVEPLEQLASVMDHLVTAIARGITEVEEELGPRIRRLERSLVNAEEDLWQARRALQEVEEEDDDGYLQQLCEEAQDRYERIQHAMQDVQQAVGRYKAAAREAHSAKFGVIAGGVTFLRERITTAKAYLALQLSSGGGLGKSVARPPDYGSGSPIDQLTSNSLPPGFFWLPLADVTEQDFISETSDWKKVSFDTMQIGVRQLYSELLPILGHNPSVTRDELTNLDKANGRLNTGLIQPDNLANLHDVFFGSDSVSAEMHPDGFYRVNGRHRVSMAKSLGMTHIPARLIGPQKVHQNQ